MFVFRALRQSAERCCAAVLAASGVCVCAVSIACAGCRLKLSLLPLMAIVVFASPALAEAVYSFAPLPQFEHRKEFATWKPIVDELHLRTGVDFDLIIPFSIPELEREFSKGTYDFAYVNPIHFTRGLRRHAYVPLVSDAAPSRGIVVVSKDSQVQKPEELNGKSLAISSANAFTSSLTIQSDLLYKFNVKMSVVAVNSHSSVYIHVANKLADAGGGAESTLREQPQAILDSLRILHTTADFPSHPVVAHPRVPTEIREKVRAAFVEMAQTPAGAAMLGRIPMSGVRSITVEDYREIAKFDAFWVEGSD